MRRSIISLLMAYVIAISVTIPAYAGLDSDVEGFMGNIGVMANVTAGGSYKTSDRTYFSGGSMQMRMKKTTIPPLITFQPPTARVSCNGLDFNAGLISILNLDMIEKLLQQSGTSLAWGILIGLSYSLPSVAKVFDEIQRYTRMLQALEGDACAIGKNIGKALGEDIAEAYNSKKTGEDIASGAKSNLSAAMEDLWDDPAGFVKKTSGNVTYDALIAIGIPKDLTGYLMDAFGTVTWQPSNLNEGSCDLSDSPEKSIPYFAVREPKLVNDANDVITKLVSGADNMTVITCGSTCDNTCLNLNEDTKSYEGIKSNVKTSLLNVVKGLAEKKVIDTNDSTYLKAPVFPEMTKYLILLSIRYRSGDITSVTSDIDNLATYYSYWLLEYVIIYINTAMGSNMEKIMNKKQVTSETAAKITEYRDTLNLQGQGIGKIFETQKKTFMDSFNYYKTVEDITTKQFKLSDYKWNKKNFGVSTR